MTGRATRPPSEVVDAIPAGLTVRSVVASQGACDTGATVACALGTLAAGESTNIHVTANVGADRAGSTIVNAATIEAAEVDPDESDNRASAATLPVSAAPSAPRLVPPDCLDGALRLVNVAAGPTRVHLAGETAKANAGRSVSLLFRGRPVATTTVAGDGTFATRVPLPARAIRTSDRSRYQAVLGPLRSLNLKLARRMRATQVSARAGESDDRRPSCTSPLARPVRTVTVRQ